jgi:GNAT superfamily N-acetyltransferase
MPATRRCYWPGRSSWSFAGEGIAASRTLVAVVRSADNDQVVGFATVAAGQDDDLELEDLFVDPDWRRRGVARQLVLQVVNTARDAGHRRLWVTGNPHALAFYIAVGFVQTDQVSTALGTALRMSLDPSEA